MHEWTTGRSAPQTCHFCTEWVEQCVSALTLRRSRLSTRSCGGDWAVRAARVCTGFRGKEDTAIQHPCALLTRHVGNAPAFMMYRQAQAGFSPTENDPVPRGCPVPYKCRSALCGAGRRNSTVSSDVLYQQHCSCSGRTSCRNQNTAHTVFW